MKILFLFGGSVCWLASAAFIGMVIWNCEQRIIYKWSGTFWRLTVFQLVTLILGLWMLAQVRMFT